MHMHAAASDERPGDMTFHPGRRLIAAMGAVLASLVLPFSASATDQRHAIDYAVSVPQATASQERPHVVMTFGTHRFTVTLDEGPAARAFMQLMPMTLHMPDLNGNEKHSSLPRSLPVDAAKVGNIRAGDVLLYGNNTLVVFYKTFPSNYSYTRIGRVQDSAGLAAALGSGSERVTFGLITPDHCLSTSQEIS